MNFTNSSLFWSISWRHVIVMISFQSLTASYSDSHKESKLPPSPPLSSSSDSGPHALIAGALVLHPVKSNRCPGNCFSDLKHCAIAGEVHISCKGLTQVEAYLKFTNTRRANSSLFFQAI